MDDDRSLARTARLWMAATVVLVSSFALCGAAEAQTAPAQPPPQPLTLDAAIQYALDHYPAIVASVEQVNVAQAGVSVSHAAYLPRLDSLWQSNLGTANNVFGQVLPQSVIPALSGPVLSSASSQSVWGSTVGALLSWEPFDFGLRGATMDSAVAGVTRARATASLTRLDVQTAVAAAFLNVAASQRAVASAASDVDRRNVLARAVHALVDADLRPGAEASRADAERAAAQTRLLQARQILASASATLSRVLGVAAGAVTIDATGIVDRIPAQDFGAVPPASHPLAALRQATMDEASAQAVVLAHTDRPRVYLQSSIFARGSGAATDGPFDTSLHGLGLDRANWAAGVQIVFPNVFDFSSLHARQAAAEASMRAETARYDEALLTIGTQQEAAVAAVDAARAIAANTPVQRAAAEQSETQARARYQAGLASIVEIADAQNLLAQAEAQDELARIDVWRALLGQAAAQGRLDPFVDALKQPAGGR